MKSAMMLFALILSACSATPRAPANPPDTAAQAPHGGPGDGGNASPISGAGLSDLAAVTFGCPKAGLNAAAREAAKAPAHGSYQFAYFNIVSNAHQSLYEVHFTSNHYEDPDLKYCVSVVCQTGLESTATVTPIGGHAAPKAGGAAHMTHCGSEPAI